MSTKTCLALTDYCYDPDQKHIVFPDGGGFACENSSNSVWVSITKEDKTDQDMGLLGNLAYQAEDSSDCSEEAEDTGEVEEGIEKIKIKKKSKAYFSYYKLGLEPWDSKVGVAARFIAPGRRSADER